MKKIIYCVLFSIVILLLTSNTASAESGGFVAPNGRTYEYKYIMGKPEFRDSYFPSGKVILYSDYPAALLTDERPYGGNIVYYDFVTGGTPTSFDSVTNFAYYTQDYSPQWTSSGNGDGNLLFTYPYTSSSQKYEMFPIDFPIYRTYQEFVDSFKPKPDDYTYDNDLGYLVGFENHSRIYEITDEVADTYVENRIFRTGWNNKTSSGLDLWRNHYSDLKIQPVIHGYGTIKDVRGNVVKELNAYVHKDPFGVETFTYQYSTNDILTDFADFYNDSALNSHSTINVKFDIYFRLLGEKDGVYVRGPWVSVSPDWTSNSWGLIDSSKVTGTTGDFASDGSFTPSGEYSFDTSIYHGTGSSITEADNGSSSFVKPSTEYPDLTTVVDSVMGQAMLVPLIFTNLFSFLPPWCLVIVGLNVSFWVVVITLKLIRG